MDGRFLPRGKLKVAGVTHSNSITCDDTPGRLILRFIWSSPAAKLFPLPTMFLVNALITCEDNILTLIHELLTAHFAQ